MVRRTPGPSINFLSAFNDTKFFKFSKGSFLDFETDLDRLTKDLQRPVRTFHLEHQHPEASLSFPSLLDILSVGSSWRTCSACFVSLLIFSLLGQHGSHVHQLLHRLAGFSLH